MEVYELRRAEKLEETVHGLCESGARDIGEYLQLLQLVNDCPDWATRLRLAQAVEEFQTRKMSNPHPVVSPDWDYPSDWKMPSWEDQLGKLLAFYPGFSADGLEEQAKFFLAQAELWKQVFPFKGREVPVFDGLAVFPLPGKASAKLGIGDLHKDLEADRKGQGLWGKLMEEILFPKLGPLFPAFRNYRKGAMGSDRFLPVESARNWLKELEAKTPGDFACRPISFGRRLAGYSVNASRWEIENVLKGVPCPGWIAGNCLLTSPGRLPKSGILWADCPGDQYRFEGSQEFGNAPYFSRGDDKLVFDTGGVGLAHGVCGSLFLSR